MKKIVGWFLLASIGFTHAKAEIVQYPGPFSIHHLQKGKLMDLFKNLDPRFLKNPDQMQVEKYLLPYNIQVISYVKEKYSEDLTEIFEADDPMLLLSGFLIAHYELHSSYSVENRPPDIISCIGEVIGIGHFTNEIIKSYSALINGSASFSSVYGLIKHFIKRYVAWWGVGIAIYEFGDCMAWW